MFKFHGNTDSKVNYTRKHRRGNQKRKIEVKYNLFKLMPCIYNVKHFSDLAYHT